MPRKIQSTSRIAPAPSPSHLDLGPSCCLARNPRRYRKHLFAFLSLRSMPDLVELVLQSSQHRCLALVPRRSLEAASSPT